ncbi:MAG: glycosyltransferase family 2 protein [Bacteroidales bacterium]|jgi:GT2 family glycosyltransferase|nr:glycosyltransferase family 2 protein [Bacteroidales bacterium]MDD2771006.1 glycosyltransferase family 2 protein [Bacteroidales bacterium]MDD3104938.1 glycosyltransferase family 2 protein [Bacteroidales bacterium]MDD3549162.1 glycosyltransferase family 2 protein [Bacteroidales bacterium]MDD4063883.1 glycosyltransferase family 2 protein [Bacteroidales bacterium]
MKPKVAIVILNWNGKHFLEQFLPLLLERTPEPCAQIFVADNGSTDGSVPWLTENFPDLPLIVFQSNLGYTGGYNQALKQIDATYYILLNSDVEVTPGWLTPLVREMDLSPECGVCMPKILSRANPQTFEYAGACGGFIDRLGFPFCRGRILTLLEKDNGQYDQPINVFWASGTCMVVRANLFHELGGLDNYFFAHMEEIDFCWRAHWAGYSVRVVPDSKILHVGGGTLPNDSPRKLYLNYRNNLLMMYKNLGRWERFPVLFIRILADHLSAIAYFFQGKYKFTQSVYKAHLHFWTMCPHMSRPGGKKPDLSSVMFKGSIVWRFFVSGKKITFQELRMQ